MTIVVYDEVHVRPNLLPITYTRPIGAIRMGISTMAERWQHFLPGEYFWQTIGFLQEIYPAAENVDNDTLFVAGHVVCSAEIAEAVLRLKPGEMLRTDDVQIAHRGPEVESIVKYEGDVVSLQQVYDIFLHNEIVLKQDFKRLTAGRTSAPIDETNIVLGDRSQIFIEEGATVEAATLNTRKGPIYIGRDTVVMEGCNLRGPIAMCEHCQVNMATQIYGATTLGPWCKVGGELNNAVMLGYSNKAHYGFLGNAVVGEWCNIGGGTSASNLKNDYTEIKLWNYPAGRFLRTGLQFCGLIMGDHSKSAVNTSFNTATVIGVGCNIISEGMPRVFVPSFLKGGTAGFENVNLTEFYALAERVMSRRNCHLTDAHRRLFQSIMDYADTFKQVLMYNA